MIENKPSIYNAQSVYNGGGGLNGELEDLNDYFENVYVYWNNVYASTHLFTPAANFSNENLFVMNKLYRPSIYNSDMAFSAGDSSDYGQAHLRVLFGSAWLFNGTTGSSVTVNPPPAGELLLKIERNAFTLNGVTYAGHYAPYTIKDIWPVPTRQGSANGPDSKMAFKELLFMDKITNQIYAHYYGVKRKIDNSLGVFDMVKGEYYTSTNFRMYNV